MVEYVHCIILPFLPIHLSSSVKANPPIARILGPLTPFTTLSLLLRSISVLVHVSFGTTGIDTNRACGEGSVGGIASLSEGDLRGHIVTPRSTEPL
jgi:hypothetical protein